MTSCRTVWTAVVRAGRRSTCASRPPTRARRGCHGPRRPRRCFRPERVPALLLSRATLMRLRRCHRWRVVKRSGLNRCGDDAAARRGCPTCCLDDVDRRYCAVHWRCTSPLRARFLLCKVMGSRSEPGGGWAWYWLPVRVMVQCWLWTIMWWNLHSSTPSRGASCQYAREICSVPHVGMPAKWGSARGLELDAAAGVGEGFDDGCLKLEGGSAGQSGEPVLNGLDASGEVGGVECVASRTQLRFLGR